MKSLPKTPDLAESVWKLVRQIPAGEVTTFGSIAKSLGDVSASRFVGGLMLHHDHQPGCNCHRIVRADGSIGKFVAGTEQKALLLRQEGHLIERQQPKSGSDENALPDYSITHHRRWADFHSHAPLAVLADFQRSLATSALIEPIPTADTTAIRIAGVDVSFVPKSDLAVAAYTEVSLADRKSVYAKTYQSRIAFPYISGYLAFRELPLLIDLLEQVRAERELADVLVVDGSGVLHPRQVGSTVRCCNDWRHEKAPVWPSGSSRPRQQFVSRDHREWCNDGIRDATRIRHEQTDLCLARSPLRSKLGTGYRATVPPGKTVAGTDLLGGSIKSRGS